MADCIIKSAGIDWVTTTSEDEGQKRLMKGYFNDIAGEDLRNGYKVVPGGAYGFYGERSRHALYAEKEARGMLQVSGARARQAFKLISSKSQCSRIDVQVTVYVGEGEVNERLAAIAAAATNHHVGRGRPAECKQVVCNGKTETVYIGSRRSDYFVRCYDKFAESSDPAYQGCVRLEVEIKHKAARALWRHMAEEGLGVGYLLSILLYVLKRRGVDTDWFDLQRQDIAPEKPTLTGIEEKIGWLASQVVPTVKKVADERGWFTAFHILFSRVLTENDFTAMMNAFSISWGN